MKYNFDLPQFSKISEDAKDLIKQILLIVIIDQQYRIF